MTLRKANFIKTKKKIKANVFDLHFDEVKWVNGNKTIRDLIVPVSYTHLTLPTKRIV